MPQEIEMGTDSFDGVETLPEVKDNLQNNKPEKIEKTPAENKEDKNVSRETEEKVKEEINYLKELGFDDWNIAKTEIENLRKKSSAPAEIRYENEESALIHKALLAGKKEPLYQYLDRQAKLEKLTSGEINKDNAPDIIKAQMAEKYKGLTADQINYKFNKLYGEPKQPIQKEDELDEDFSQRMQEWEEKKKEAEIELVIEAKIVKPELEKLKSELKFPELPQAEPQEKSLTPEELVEIKKNEELFVKDAEIAVKDFEGLTVEYKDKDVDIKSTYSLSDEERGRIVNALKFLAENSYNSNALFAERWVNDDMTFNFKQMVRDFTVLETYDKSAQKFIGDAAAKAKKQFIKEKKNIDLNDSNNGNGNMELPEKTSQQKNEEAIWS